MAEFEFEGRVIVLGELKTGTSQRTGNTWASQDVTLEETHGQYPKKICVNVFGEERIKQLDFKVNEECLIKFSINAQEYQGRWFNKLECWAKETRMQAQPTAQPAQAYVAQPTAQPYTAAQPNAGQQNTAHQPFPPEVNGTLFGNDDNDKGGLPF